MRVYHSRETWYISLTLLSKLTTKNMSEAYLASLL